MKKMKFNTTYLFTSRELNMMRLSKMKAKYIVVHNAANRHHASAKQEAQNQFNNNTRKGTGGVAVHFYVDENEIYHMIPLDYHGWHSSAGAGEGNKKSIGIEICRSLDYTTDRYARAEAKTVDLVKWLMKDQGIKIGEVKRHYDFDPNKQRCPHRMFEGKPNTWNKFIGKVEGEKAKPTKPEKPANPGKGLYYTIGDEVIVNGVLHINADGAQPGRHYKAENIITHTAAGKPYPYHIKGLGWVKESAVQGNYTESYVNKINRLAEEVIDNQHGNGDKRKKALGADYQAVQNRVNEILGYSKPVAQKPKPKHEYIQLDKKVAKWGVYRTNVYPVAKNIFGYLAPKKYGGLEYKVLGRPYPNTYTIKTGTFGTVNIWAGKGTDHKIVNK